VPGITIRWKAAYCMLLNATDDVEQEGVAACLSRQQPQAIATADPCAQNAFWKEQFCRVRHDELTAVRACVEDPAMIPRIVRRGAGGA
jgi:hypothetical protein